MSKNVKGRITTAQAGGRPRYRVTFINLKDEKVTETFSVQLAKVIDAFGVGKVLDATPLNISAYADYLNRKYMNVVHADRFGSKKFGGV